MFLEITFSTGDKTRSTIRDYAISLIAKCLIDSA